MSSIIPPIPTAPASGAASNAATTRRACATAASDGMKAALIGPTWSGCMAMRPVNPSVAAAAQDACSPAVSRKSAYSVSTGSTNAARAAIRHRERTIRYVKAQPPPGS